MIPRCHPNSTGSFFFPIIACIVYGLKALKIFMQRLHLNHSDKIHGKEGISCKILSLDHQEPSAKIHVTGLRKEIKEYIK
jgi:hypothetical protein